MGLIERVLGLVFGGGSNVVAETAEVFRVNAEGQAQRDHLAQAEALAQFAQEFRVAQRGWFDRLMDALNRIPRPAMALGTLWLFAAAMVDPAWFAARMAGIALVPEPLWWLLGAVVSFYFGARHQAKGQELQRDLAATMAAVPGVIRQVERVEAIRQPPHDVSSPEARDTDRPGENPALADWRATL